MFGQIPLDLDQKSQREASALKRLNGCCKGLVEQGGHLGKRTPYKKAAITFTHRSVVDFLFTSPRKEVMSSELGDFDPADAFSQLALAEGMVAPEGYYQSSVMSGCALTGKFCTMDLLILLRARSDRDRAPYAFLQALQRAASRRRKEQLGHGSPYGGLLDHYANRGVREMEFIFYKIAERLEISAIPHDPVYMATLFGNFDYAKWRLSPGHNDQLSRVGKEVILCVFLNSLTKSRLPPCRVTEPSQVLDLAEDLITLHGLGPEARLRHAAWEFCIRPAPETPYFVLFFHYTSHISLTVWQGILSACYISLFRTYPGPCQDPDLWPLGYLLEKYLEHGADPYFCVSTPEISHLGRMIVTVRFGKKQVLSGELMLDYTTSRRILRPDSVQSLAQLISSLPGLQNRDRILRLIDRNMGSSKSGCGDSETLG